MHVYHLNGGGNSGAWGAKRSGHLQGPNPNVYLDNAKKIGNDLMVVFISNPSFIPFSDVILQEWSANTISSSGGFGNIYEITTV